MAVRQNVIKDSRHVAAMANEKFEPLPFKPISADSHVTEPPNLYRDFIDPRFREQAPHVEIGPKGGSVFVIDNFFENGSPFSIHLGSMAAAGMNPKDMKMETARFEDLHKGGYDGKARVADQERDGIGGEVIYPSVGMVLCNHRDADFKQACMWAYNRWLEEFQSAAPDRIFGLGQTAVGSVKQTIDDMEKFKEMHFCGVMLPSDPSTGFEYDDPQFDPVWEASVALKLPITFHIMTGRRDRAINDVERSASRRNISHYFHTLIRANQDVISTFLWGRVFERFPDLKLVCTEADAGWVPHFMYRLDHFYNRHRFHSNTQEMAKMPSERISENVYFTFQDDLVALNSLDMLNPKRLLWASDFPHSDSTWPWSQQLLANQTKNIGEDERRSILRDNVVELFNLPNH